MTRWMQFFALIVVIPLLLSLTACEGTGAYGTPRTSSAIVTDDPSKLPDMSWQTAGQRQVLMSQNQQLATTPAAPEPTGTAVKVAVLVPLSGKNASLGQAMLKAAQLALFDVGSHNFELLTADTGSTAQGAASAAQRAIADGANLILGPIFAEDVRAVKPVAGPARVPMVAFTTDWTLADNNTYIFGFLPTLQAERVVSYAQSRGLSKLAIIAPQTEYADLIVAAISRTTPPAATLRYKAGQADLTQELSAFTTQHANTTANGPFFFDSVLLPLGGESLRSLTAQLDQYGIRGSRVRFIGTGLWDDTTALSDPMLNGGWFAAPDPAARLDFERRYQQTFGGSPQRLATLAYDATALAAVLARSDTTGQPYSRDRMTSSRGFAGIDGVFRFRNDGLAERALAVVEIRGGRTQVIDPAPTAFARSGM